MIFSMNFAAFFRKELFFFAEWGLNISVVMLYLAGDRLQPFTVFSECSILDVLRNSECASVEGVVSLFVLNNFSENRNHSYTKHSQSSLLFRALFYIQRLFYSLYNSKSCYFPLSLSCTISISSH